MEAVFDRFIRVPKMIYGTRRLLFRHFIEQHGAEIEETELSALTIIADKYSVNDIKTVCRRVLTSHRVKRNKVSHLWIFSSCEEKAFFGQPSEWRRLMDDTSKTTSPQIIKMTWMWVPTNKTIFKNVLSL